MPHPAIALADDIVRVRAEQDRQLDRLGRAPTLDEQREMADLAAQHRELFADLEMSVPTPRGNDTPVAYEAELLRRLQRFSPSWRDSNLTRLATAGALGRGIVQGIIEDAWAVASDKTVGSFRVPGALREIRRPDRAGHEIVSFAGNPLSWMGSFMAPCTKVEGFRDQRSGRNLWRSF